MFLLFFSLSAVLNSKQFPKKLYCSNFLLFLHSPFGSPKFVCVFFFKTIPFCSTIKSLLYRVFVVFLCSSFTDFFSALLLLDQSNHNVLLFLVCVQLPVRSVFGVGACQLLIIRFCITFESANHLVSFPPRVYLYFYEKCENRQQMNCYLFFFFDFENQNNNA